MFFLVTSNEEFKNDRMNTLIRSFLCLRNKKSLLIDKSPYI